MAPGVEQRLGVTLVIPARQLSTSGHQVLGPAPRRAPRVHCALAPLPAQHVFRFAPKREPQVLAPVRPPALELSGAVRQVLPEHQREQKSCYRNP